MLSLGAGVTRTCAGPTRRDFLRVGGLSTLGLTLTDLNPLAAAAATATGSAGGERSVILLMLVGGPSQLETWDPKPDAPADVRGPFGSIATAVPGVRICEHLPADGAADGPRHADSLDAPRRRPDSRDRPPAPPDRPALSGRRRRRRTSVPWSRGCGGAGTTCRRSSSCRGPIGNTGVGIPHGQSAGRLGPAYEPFHVAADPAAAGYDARDLFDRAQRFLDEAPDPLPVRSSPRPTACCRAGSRRLRSRRGARGRARRLRPRAPSARAACSPAAWSRRVFAWSP